MNKEQQILHILSTYDKRLGYTLLNQSKAVDRLYHSLIKEASKLGTLTRFNDPNAPFYFADYPETKKKVDNMMRKFAESLQATIVQGDKDAWLLANAKNDALVDALYKGINVPEETMKAWKEPHISALEGFQKRKVGSGMDLSDRVWKLSEQAKSELELALDIGLGEGKSAQSLSRDVRKYLNEPNKLFRRVRDKHGNLRLSQAAQAYNPGRGVYRSSYKNAMRLTRTENNMAYQQADHKRWNKLDFVIGQEVRLSNNHTLNGVPFEDMCDFLVGKYPKDFVFTCWHPHCRCTVVPILADWNEQLKVMEKQLDGEDVSGYRYKGEITEMPKNYNKWIDDNRDRIYRAKSVPLWIKNNYVGGQVGKGLNWEVAKQNEEHRKTILEAAKDRQVKRTSEDIRDIKDRWALRQEEMQYPPEQRALFRKIEAELGMKRGFSMPYLRADQQSANPYYGKGKEYSINCQTCAPAYMLRRWGFDVYALGNKKGNLSDKLSRGLNIQLAWKDVSNNAKPFTTFTNWLKSKNYKQMSKYRYKEFFDEVCKEDGTYEIALSWKGKGRHNTIVERKNGLIRYVEPQLDNSRYSKRYNHDFDYLCDNMSPKPCQIDGVMRVDDAIFNIELFHPIFDKNARIPLHTQRTLNNAAIRRANRSNDEINAIKTKWAERARKRRIEEIAEQRHALRNDAEVQKQWDEWRKKRDLMRKTAENIINVAKDYPWADSTKLQELYNLNRSTELITETKSLAKTISDIKKRERLYEPLIPNVRALSKTYSMNDVEKAYNELNSVINRWLYKYNYSSIDAAPLQHLINKLDFELSNPTIRYSNKTIINKAINEKIVIIKKQIQWDKLINKVNQLKAFTTDSKIYHKCITLIDDAIKLKDINALQSAINKAEIKKYALENKQIKNAGATGSAINKEYKGGAFGVDISSKINVKNMTSEDPYRGTFTNNVARMQGFDNPAKLVSQAEFDILEKDCQEVFYRTVNDTVFKGVNMTSQEFASQLYVADKLELNGPGGRVYGDGMYVATSAWDGARTNALTNANKRNAYNESYSYGHSNPTISEMTFTRKPKIIKQTELNNIWNNLDKKTKDAFGCNPNTYACALGYDAMYCNGPNYMVIWNRSIIAVLKK